MSFTPKKHLRRSVLLLMCLVLNGFGKPDPNHWSFVVPAEQTVPELGERNPVDAFLLEKLKAKGLRFSEVADPVTLIRRVSLDLTGLPPEFGEIVAFEVAWKKNPEAAYEVLMNRLLNSLRYGERWAQHWLDAVRYADTHGFEVNTPRPNAWPYRDYVIQAFNEDVPYDRFVFEQLAGDTAGNDAATGFLVTAAALMPGQIGKDEASIKRARQDELDEIVINACSTFVGLTAHCARCHDHKFDAISQKDYFRVQALFGGVRYGDRPDRGAVKANRERVVELDRDIAAKEKALLEAGVRMPVSARFNSEVFEPRSARFVRFTVLKTNQREPCIDELEVWSGHKNVAVATDGVTATSSGDYQDPSRHRLEFINDGKYGNGRSWIASTIEKSWVMLDLGKVVEIDRITWGRDREEKFQDRLAVEYRIEAAEFAGDWIEVASSKDRLKSLDPKSLGVGVKKDVEAYQALLGERRRLKAGGMVFAGRFVKPPVTHLLNRGDAMQPDEVVLPGVPEVLGDLGLKSDALDVERRTKFAEWLVAPENPLTARVMVNRVWHWHFGAGLVKTPSDFGAMGGKPSHPELLDWLARWFVKEGWSVKKLHRLILTSRAYQQSGVPRSTCLEVDAGNRLLWRFQPRRLEAEAIRDSILQVTGVLDLSMGGPGYSLFKPNTNYVRVYDPKEDFGKAEWRRMIYAHRVRMEQDGVFGAFDRPDAGLICSRRTQSTTPLQALNLFNSRFVSDQSVLLADRFKEGSEDERITGVFQAALGREPDEEELSVGRNLVAEHGLAQLCRVIFNTNEFLYLP